jgi:hypothetical protein
VTTRSIWATLVVAACAIGCATSATPEGVARAWADAALHDDPDAAYALLSKRVRSGLSQTEFNRRWRLSRVEAAAQAGAIRAGGQPASLGAEARARGGARAALVFDRETLSTGWRLGDLPVSTVAGAGSPEEAARALGRALAEHRWEAALTVLSSGVRETVMRELRERQSALQEIGPIEITGDKARARAGRFEVSFERAADGAWKVVGIR